MKSRDKRWECPMPGCKGQKGKRGDYGPTGPQVCTELASNACLFVVLMYKLCVYMFTEILQPYV